MITEKIFHCVHNHPHDGVVLFQRLDGDQDAMGYVPFPLTDLYRLQHKMAHLMSQKHTILPVYHVFVVYLQAFTVHT